MQRLLIAALLGAPLLLAPWRAGADVYRCKQADGHTAFQDHPCPGTAKGNNYELHQVQGYTPAPLAAPESAAPPPRGARADSLPQAFGAEVDTSREGRCSNARNALAVLGQQRPVAVGGAAVDDNDRASLSAAAQQEVDNNCDSP